MAFPKSKRKRLIVDDLPYVACVSQNGRTEDGGFRIRVIFEAEYGCKSLCVVAGMVNRNYWLDFPNIDMENTYIITPRIICELIRYALANGWSPTESKAQTTIKLDNDGLFAIMRRIKSDT